jgi:hypothetical protein
MDFHIRAVGERKHQPRRVSLLNTNNGEKRQQEYKDLNIDQETHKVGN